MTDRDAKSRILLAHKNESDRKALASMLENVLGHTLTKSVGLGTDLLDAFKDDVPDLVVSSVYLEDGDAIEYLIKACEFDPRPSIIVTSKDDLMHVERALEDHVMSYLVEPITANDLRPSILLVLQRFQEFEELRQEVEDLTEALEARKVIEKAKGWLMGEKGLSEHEAHRRLQEMASKKRKKIVEIAESLLLAADL